MRVDVVEIATDRLVQLADRIADPRGRVDAVGDAQDWLLDDPGPRRVGRVGMPRKYWVGETLNESFKVEKDL